MALHALDEGCDGAVFNIGAGSDRFTNLGTIEVAPAASLTMAGIRSMLSNPEQGTIRGGGTLRLQAGTSFTGVDTADINLINNGAVHPGNALGIPGILPASLR